MVDGVVFEVFWLVVEVVVMLVGSDCVVVGLCDGFDLMML